MQVLTICFGSLRVDIDRRHANLALEHCGHLLDGLQVAGLTSRKVRLGFFQIGLGGGHGILIPLTKHCLLPVQEISCLGGVHALCFELHVKQAGVHDLLRGLLTALELMLQSIELSQADRHALKGFLHRLDDLTWKLYAYGLLPRVDHLLKFLGRSC